MRLSVQLSCFFMALVLCPLMASGMDHSNTIVLGSPPHGWPPYIMPESMPGPGKGIMPEILRTVAEEHGYTVKMAYYPEKRGRLMLRNGTIDAYCNSKKWMQHPDSYRWTTKVITSEDVIVCSKKHPLLFESPEDLHGKDIGVVLGFSYPTLETQFKKHTIHRHYAPSTEHLLQMVSRGHIDGVVTNRIVANWILHTNQTFHANDFHISDATVDSAPYGFVFSNSRNWSDFISIFNKELNAMREDGRLAAILAQYQ